MKALEQLDRTILLCRDHTAEGLSDEQICRGFLSTRVLCISDSPNLSSHGGQTALITLVSLLSRMGMQVALSVPDVPLIRPQPPLPPLPGSSVRNALTAISDALVTGATVSGCSEFDPDLIFVLGDSAVGGQRQVPYWRLSGDDWGGAVGLEGELPVRRWTIEWPIGAMVSAALAAGEAFKFTMRRFPLRSQLDQRLFEPSRGCGWHFGSVPIPQGVLDFGEVDVVSAGAICQAALYALLRLPNAWMKGRIFDGDRTDPSNLNRNMLTLLRDVGAGKSHLVALRSLPNFHLTAIPEPFAGASGTEPILAPRVLVGVDHIPSRWGVQRCAPGWVGVSGTTHLGVLSHRPGEPCSGCLHFKDDPADGGRVPTVSFVSFWAGLAMAVRLIREAIGFPYPAGQQQLWMVPLRMDGNHAGVWMRVAPRQRCPVGCGPSVAAA